MSVVPTCPRRCYVQVDQATDLGYTVRSNVKRQFCPRRSMDRIWVCGTHDVGSIPAEGTKRIQKTAEWQFSALCRPEPSRGLCEGGEAGQRTLCIL